MILHGRPVVRSIRKWSLSSVLSMPNQKWRSHTDELYLVYSLEELPVQVPQWFQRSAHGPQASCEEAEGSPPRSYFDAAVDQKRVTSRSIEAVPRWHI